MATYIPGVTDYIPQYQPWQPDYNFLGNILQTRQNKYDQNYKQLSETYGTLLNSPMLREDNIQQRNEFFSMIDNDIKRISGMDLSLQQNVDSANKVFDSLYQNKNIVKDMTFTKEYQNQLQTAENYRNCIDQEKCGGKYWDVGVNYLNYKADEFKNASKEEAMNMSPGRFAPMINIQEKAMLYAEKLLGKGGAFGVQNVTWSKDGKYQITMKNGQLLQVPLEQLLLNQYGQDQAIIDMVNAETYVNRKSYVKQNAARFGGDENAAEDEYFAQVDAHIQAAQQKQKDIQDKNSAVKAKKAIMEKEITTNGSSGDDDLAFDYEATSIDSVAYDAAAKEAQETANIASSIFEAGDNRQMKRQRVDALFARSLLNKKIKDAADAVVAMTGSVDIKADEYAKSYYDFSLDMAKQKDLYERMDENEYRKNVYELSKNQALMEYKKRGPISQTGQSKAGEEGPSFPGMSSGPTDASTETREEIIKYTNSSMASATSYYTGYANQLASIVKTKTGDEKRLAGYTLEKIFGKASKNKDGKMLSGYDANTNMYYDINGAAYTDPSEFAKADQANWRTHYANAQTAARENRSISSHAAYLNSPSAKQAVDSYNLNQEMLETGSKVWKDNNKAVMNYALTMSDQYFKNDTQKMLQWANYFKSDGNLKSKEEFVKNYVKSKEDSFTKGLIYNDYYKYFVDPVTKRGVEPYTEKEAAVEAEKLYAEFDKTRNDIYNSSTLVNGKPIVKAIHGTGDFGYNVSGSAAQTSRGYYSRTDNPDSFENQSLNTFFNEALHNGFIVQGNQVTQMDVAATGDVQDDNAVQAMREYISDIQSGRFSDEDKTHASKMYYMDNALSSDKHIGLIFYPSETWLKTKKGTDEKPTWADNIDPTKGIAMYTMKESAKNGFREVFNAKPFDWLVNHKDINRSVDKGGNLTIKKRSSDGSIFVSGYLNALQDGKLIKRDFVQTYDSETGGQNLVTGTDVFLDRIATANTTGVQPNKFYDLRDVVNGLNQKAGDVTQQDIGQSFLERVQFNMQNMQQR